MACGPQFPPPPLNPIRSTDATIDRIPPFTRSGYRSWTQEFGALNRRQSLQSRGFTDIALLLPCRICLLVYHNPPPQFTQVNGEEIRHLARDVEIARPIDREVRLRAHIGMNVPVHIHPRFLRPHIRQTRGVHRNVGEEQIVKDANPANLLEKWQIVLRFVDVMITRDQPFMPVDPPHLRNRPPLHADIPEDVEMVLGLHPLVAIGDQGLIHLLSIPIGPHRLPIPPLEVDDRLLGKMRVREKPDRGHNGPQVSDQKLTIPPPQCYAIPFPTQPGEPVPGGCEGGSATHRSVHIMEPSPAGFVSVSDYLRLPRSPETWLLKDLLPTGGVALMYSPPKVGKALHVETPIPTPSGWTTMADVHPGHVIFGSQGQPVTVLAESDVLVGRSCFTITFDDGNTMVTDAHHEWFARHKTNKKGPASRQIVTTGQMAQHLSISDRAYQRSNWAIPLPQALTFPPLTDRLPTDPSLLGTWLGDGTSRANTITTADPEIVEAWRRGGWTVTQRTPYTYRVTHPRGRVGSP